MRAALGLVLLLLARATLAADAPPVAARATASKTEVSIGERFTVDVRATGPAGCVFEFPAEASPEGFELVTAPADSNPPTGTHRYQARVWALGDTTLPAIAVRYRLADGTGGEVETATIPIHVVSLLPKDKSEQKLADVRAPVAVGIGRAFWIGLVALLLLVGGLVAWLVMRRKPATTLAAAVIPELEPDQEARLALDRLVSSGRLARAEYRPFYIELTAIAKRYLERRLEAPIVEMTTAEMLARLRATPQGLELVPTLRDLSGAADQIKFARGLGLIEEAERHVTATRAMIDSLEVRLAPPSPTGTPAAPAAATLATPDMRSA